jgi:hypothetical protein
MRTLQLDRHFQLCVNVVLGTRMWAAWLIGARVVAPLQSFIPFRL